MSLDIGEALENGFNRTLTRNSAIFIGLFSVVSLLTTIFSDSLVRSMIDQGMFDVPGQVSSGTATPLALGLPASVSGALLVVISILSTLVTIAAVRVYVTDETRSIPRDYFTDKALWTVANIIGGGILFGLIVGIGFLALVIPGIFLLSALYFWNFYVIDEGQNLVEAMKSSWRDTKENRLRTLGLLILVVVATGVFGGVTGVALGFVGNAIAGPALTAGLNVVTSSVITVFTIATFTQAYTQLKE